MSGLCRLRGMAGQPREGFHAHRIPGLDLALWDVVGTVCMAAFISVVFKVHFLATVLVLFLSAMILHRLFCVETRL